MPGVREEEGSENTPQKTHHCVSRQGRAEGLRKSRQDGSEREDVAAEPEDPSSPRNPHAIPQLHMCVLYFQP